MLDRVQAKSKQVDTSVFSLWFNQDVSNGRVEED
jgi:hypothetical protein